MTARDATGVSLVARVDGGVVHVALSAVRDAVLVVVSGVDVGARGPGVEVGEHGGGLVGGVLGPGEVGAELWVEWTGEVFSAHELLAVVHGFGTAVVG